MADQPDKISWHPGFYGAAELEFRANSDVLTFIPEYSLSKEPLRADLLVIRKKPDVQIENAVLRSAGQRIEERFPGIYYVTGRVMFDTQVVVTGRLKAEGHSALRILSRTAGREDVRRFLDGIPGLNAPLDRHNVEAVLQVSISANRKLYDDFRKEGPMCEALEDLMKDVIEERVNQAVKLNTEQVTEQKDKGVAAKLFGMGMSVDLIADVTGRSVDSILKWVSPLPQP